MNFSHKERDPKDALGIFLDLEVGEGDDCLYSCDDTILPYRTMLRICLPPGREDTWAASILSVLLEVEGKNAWPIRVDYANILQHISEKDLMRIDHALSRVTVYVYGSPDQTAFDEETYRRWFNSCQRVAYTNKPVRKAQMRKIC